MSTPIDPANLFRRFASGPEHASTLRQAITVHTRGDEPAAVARLLPQATLPAEEARAAHRLALQLAKGLRERKGAGGREGLVQGLMQEYALSSQEGIALMCLAEALLRIPDTATRDALIRDKIAHGNWRGNAGKSPSVFVNAASWGLLLTGKLVATHSEATLSSQLTRLIAKGGEPLIRKGVDVAMRMMGEQFVMGETIQEALQRARRFEAQGFRYSYDMLGEAAMTADDAERYRQSYEMAINAIGVASGGRGVYEGPGISIKLSALHPRYSRAQYDRVMAELYPVLRDLALLARQYDVGLNIDAEEADRLELSLDLLERLCFEPALAGWKGIGFVVQAYQKRCSYVIDWLVDLAKRSGHRLMVRLVKGAYWDSEIKRAQIEGQSGFPVYTRKVYTDVSYLACAKKLLAAPAEIYPQFATHNAYTVAAVYTLADPAKYQPGQYEFQCLHGMGEPLYEQIVGRAGDGKLGRPCRIYAPAGTHETLLAYLVRRLLENGANTSFVNRIADPSIALDALVEDPVATVERLDQEEGGVGRPHPKIAIPAALFGARLNSAGIDLSNDETLRSLEHALAESAAIHWKAEPALAGTDTVADANAAWQPVLNPADHHDQVGQVRTATPAQIEAALKAASDFAPEWTHTPVAERSAALEHAAGLLQARLTVLLGLLAREAGKTYSDGITEVREAVDFLRFYVAHARADFGAAGDRALGPVVCISPWNFPLSIFLGQVSAALAAGNPVLAKPAEQTPLVAAEAVHVLHQAGIPRAALQLLPGDGPSVAAPMVADARVQGVMFTGSTEVARLLQQTLAGRTGPGGAPVPLIAETGGQNAMIVDSSALPEQVVADVVSSAFGSAGQRCSALRVLCVQEDAADRLITMLRGAVAEQTVGNPAALQTDVGPVIDAEAQANIERHVKAMQDAGHAVQRLGKQDAGAMAAGTFVAPTVIEIDSIAELKREVFGPVLHVLRYKRAELPQLVAQINATGYGLTLGLHTRIDETIRQVVGAARVGNVYVNRNIVGAVVGVQPFGGEGLSGTGPKAGGPLYMYRLLQSGPDDVIGHALAAALPGARADAPVVHGPAAAALLDWIRAHRTPDLATRCERLAKKAATHREWTLTGPTGEKNVYALRPREAALCLAESDDSLLFQLTGALAMGCRVVWPAGAQTQALRATLPLDVQEAIALASDWTTADVHFDVALYQGGRDGLLAAARALAKHPGPVVSLRRFDPKSGGAPLEALVVEQSTSTNTAAAGGNASLMSIG